MRAIATILLVIGGAAPALAESTGARGLAGRVEIEYAHPLRARAAQSALSPMLVRVSAVPGTSRQSIEFIGAVAGAFDLRDFVERQDGEAAGDLQAIPVSIVTSLPDDHGTDLYISDESWLSWRTRYRGMLWAGIALWAMVPIVYAIVRAIKKPLRAAAPPPPAPERTIADQLRDALAAARERSLTVEERGQLELLLLRFLAASPAGPAPAGNAPADVLRAVRAHPESRGLVTAVERWLHRRDGETLFEQAASALEDFHATRLVVQNRAIDWRPDEVPAPAAMGPSSAGARQNGRGETPK